MRLLSPVCWRLYGYVWLVGWNGWVVIFVVWMVGWLGGWIIKDYSGTGIYG